VPRRTRCLRAHVEDESYALTRGHGSDEAAYVDDWRHGLDTPGRALPQRRSRVRTALGGELHYLSVQLERQ